MDNLIPHSIGDVGEFICMISNGGDHTRRQWARTTVGQILQIDPNATPERRKLLLDLKHKMVEAIEPYFGKSENVQLVFEDLLSSVRGSDWELSFCHPAVRTQIFLCMSRNLASARKGN